jgi:phosphoglucomutase
LHYADLEKKFGVSCYQRRDNPCTAEQKAALAALQPDKLPVKEVAGEKILSVLTNAPGNNAPIGGLKVTTASGWFAIRPSGTENLLKIYGESMKGTKHLEAILATAESLIQG